MRCVIAAAVATLLAAGGGCDRNASGPERESRAQDEATARQPKENDDETAGAKSKNTEEEADEPGVAAEMSENEKTSDQSGESEDAGKSLTLWAGSVNEDRVSFEAGRRSLLDAQKAKTAFKELSNREPRVPYDERHIAYEDIKNSKASTPDRVEVLTTNGPIWLAIERVRRDGRPDGFEYEFETEHSKKLADQPDWLLLTPDGGFDAKAKFETPAAKPVHKKAAPKLREKILAGLEKDEHRERAREKLEDRHITAVPGRFPGPHAQFVMVNLTRGGDRIPLLRSIYLAEDTGEVSATLVEPFVGALGQVEFLGRADPDGDGTDGILYIAHTDGYFVRWLDFNADGEPVGRTLAGYGA